MAALGPGDLEKWIRSLGSLLPAEVVRELCSEVRTKQVDGARFGEMVSSRDNPILGDVLRPTHMAKLRRVWTADHGASLSRASSSASMFSTPARGGGCSTSNSRPALNYSASQPYAMSRQASEQSSFSTPQKGAYGQSALQHDSRPVPTPSRQEYVRPSSAACTQNRVTTPQSSSSYAPAPRHDRGAAWQSSSSYAPAPRVADRPPRGPGGMSTSQQAPQALQATPEPRTARGGIDYAKAWALSSEAPQATPELKTARGGVDYAKAWNNAANSTPSFQPPSRGAPRVVPPPRVAAPALDQEADLDFDMGLPSPPGPVFPVVVFTKNSGRPVQVPRLNIDAMQGPGSPGKEKLGKKGWLDAEKGYLNSRSRSASDAQKINGYATASVDDQQRISEFYGYRDEGFIATMNSLKTDMIRPRLYIGSMADASYWPMVQQLGLTHILNVAVEAQQVDPPYKSEGIKYMMLPLQDSPDQCQILMRQRFRTLRSATQFINSVLKGRQPGTIMVHCVQGLSRSAAVVAAYLMEYLGVNMERAVSELQDKHRGCLAALHWQDMLYKFNAELLRGI